MLLNVVELWNYYRDMYYLQPHCVWSGDHNENTTLEYTQ